MDTKNSKIEDETKEIDEDAGFLFWKHSKKYIFS